MENVISGEIRQINAYELDNHSTLADGDLMIVQAAGADAALQKVGLAALKSYMAVPDSTLTDTGDVYIVAQAYTYTANSNREYNRILLSDSCLTTTITFAASQAIATRNEHYLLVTNSARDSSGSVAVTQGSFAGLIGMTEAVEIPAGKSVEFSFKIYNTGSNQYLVVTHSGVL